MRAQIDARHCRAAPPTGQQARPCVGPPPRDPPPPPWCGKNEIPTPNLVQLHTTKKGRKTAVFHMPRATYAAPSRSVAMGLSPGRVRTGPGRRAPPDAVVGDAPQVHSTASPVQNTLSYLPPAVHADTSRSTAAELTPRYVRAAHGQRAPPKTVIRGAPPVQSSRDPLVPPTPYDLPHATKMMPPGCTAEILAIWCVMIGQGRQTPQGVGAAPRQSFKVGIFYSIIHTAVRHGNEHATGAPREK